MSVASKKSGMDVWANQRSDVACLNETFWGYVIRPNRTAINRAAYGEMAASFSGVLLAMAAYGQWLLPGTINSVEVLPFKIFSTVVFAVFACLLYLIARRGLCAEVQVDIQRKEIRTARRNRHGVSTQIDTLPFHDVGSVFIKRAKAPVARDKLYIRPSDNQPLIDVVVGSSSVLEPIMQRLSDDLREGNTLKDLRLAKPRSAEKAARTRSAFAAL